MADFINFSPFLALRYFPCRSNTNNLSIEQHYQFRLLQFQRRFHHKSISKSSFHSPIDSSSSSSINVSSEEQYLVSTTECSDGSIVFQFGNAFELEQRATLKEAKVLHGRIEVDGLNGIEEADNISDRHYDSEDNDEVRMIIKKTDESTMCKEESGGVENTSNVAGTESKPISDKQLLHDTVLDRETSNSSNPVIAVEMGIDLEVDNGHDFHVENQDTSEEKSEDQSGPSLYRNEDIEFMDLAVASDDCHIDSVMVNVTGEDSVVGDPIVEMPLSASLKSEKNIDEDKTCETMEELVETDNTESLIMINEGNQSANLESEVNKADARSSIVINISDPKTIELNLTENNVERVEVSMSGLFLSCGSSSLPHPSKELTGGGDSYFVSCQNWFGVADGIGQWSLEGSDAGLFAHELMKNCEKIVSDPNKVLVPNSKEVLIRSVAEAESPGFSTILVAYFDGQVLDVANIGDSGFLIIKNGMVFKRSSPMVHELHFPLQITKGDDPSELIEEYKIDLDEGDVILVATDGLFDNLFEQEIASIVRKSLQDNCGPKEIAELLATKAQERGKSASARSPFANAAQAVGYVGYTGGKLDDVTVIVSLVRKEPSACSQ